MRLLAIHNAVVTITLDARATYNIAAQEHLWELEYKCATLKLLKRKYKYERNGTLRKISRCRHSYI